MVRTPYLVTAWKSDQRVAVDSKLAVEKMFVADEPNIVAS